MIPKIFIHLKTGNEYLVLHRGVVNATNAQNGDRMVLYTPYTHSPSHEPWYVRLESEFDTKFKEKSHDGRHRDLEAGEQGVASPEQSPG